MKSPSARERPFEAQEDSTTIESSGTVVASSTPSTTEIESTEVGSDASSAAGDAHNGAGRFDDDQESIDASSREASRTEPQDVSSNSDRNGTKTEANSSEPVAQQGCRDEVSTGMCFDGDDERNVTGSSSVSRKRPASDFLPISAEIKRIGVEIPENKANQSRSEVRRISPVLVSLRERTLGEISLSSDSCLIAKNNSILDDSLTSSCRTPMNGSFDDCVRMSLDPEATDAEAAHSERASSAEDSVTCRRNLEYSDAYVDEDTFCSLTLDSPEREHHPCQEKQCEELSESCACDDSVPTNDACMAEKSSKLLAEHVDSPDKPTPDRKDKKRPILKKKPKKNATCDGACDTDANTDSEESQKESCFVQRCAYENTNVQTTEYENQRQMSSPVVTRSKSPFLEPQSPLQSSMKDCKVLLARISSPKLVKTAVAQPTKNEAASEDAAQNPEEDEAIVPAASSSPAENLQPLDDAFSPQTTSNLSEETKPSAEHEDPPMELCLIQRCAHENVQKTEPENHSNKQMDSSVVPRPKSPVEANSPSLNTTKSSKIMIAKVMSPKLTRSVMEKFVKDETTFKSIIRSLREDEEVLITSSSTSNNRDSSEASVDSPKEMKLSEHNDLPRDTCSVQRCTHDVQKTEREDHAKNQLGSPMPLRLKTTLAEEQSSPLSDMKECKVILARIRTGMESLAKDDTESRAATKDLGKNEEVVLASLSSSVESLQPLNNLNASAVTPSSPEEMELSAAHKDPPKESCLVQRGANENTDAQKTEPEDHFEQLVGSPTVLRAKTPPVEANSPLLNAMKSCRIMIAKVTSPKPTSSVAENFVKDETTSESIVRSLRKDEEVVFTSSSPSTSSSQLTNNRDSLDTLVDSTKEMKPSEQKDLPKDTCFVQRCTHDVQKTEPEDRAKKQLASPMSLRLKTPSPEEQSPSSNAMKECKVMLARVRTAVENLIKDETASRAVIKNLGENEEVVFTSLSSSVENLQPLNNLDTSEVTPGSPELEPSADVPEAVDTETETETGSDSSEVSVTNVRLRGCDDDPVSDQISCPESESMCCVDINSEIITRLEAERPEAFTEDSAESLALATGARDEVRSDGSDSGLGSEIPGDHGPAPAPESDSETSFLDRIPDDILSDKEKAANQLDSFAPTVATLSTPQTPLPVFSSPSKSNLKRRLIDSMEGAPTPKRSNTDESMKKKRNIHFDAVTVYYFPRAQGFTCVPSQGGSTLGMSATHTHAERFSLSEHATEQRRIHRARLAQLRSERAANCVVEAASSSEDPSDDTDEEQSDNEELDIDSYYFLQPVPTWQRRALLRAAGVRRIDAVEKDECRDIRASREHCGCGCKGYCDPESCPCSRANVKCQVDRAGFPCGCTRDGCANSSGRIEFNPVRVRTHFIHTLMRLELEKKQREEEGTDHDASDNQNGRSPLREINLGSVMENRNAESCLNGGGFTTLHYENHDAGDGGANCQPEVPGTREDSLDLYAIRDDCYPSEDTVDGTQGPQRKLHPEFSQAFQTFSSQTNVGVNFQQPTYQDYQPYANLPSTSRVQFQPQFQAVPGNSGFSHYAPYGQDTGSIQGNCQVHPEQHSSNYETSFAQDESTGSQYTNLNSVQPMNTVQQMGKLEPFSELLSGRYSYYGEMEPQAHGTYHGNGTKVEVEKSNEQQSESTEECDENFGEIIKKSMVETVSA
ncbi:microtubule-associated protein futsch [Colletes gigas]|uniref:microtubule-associated protein futsch n=1 Tax=Colletes gigas TaxID=935657 RepID=UPI001C9B683D|nr:microtubule-associated protein futsch [Colletes gigas]